jgi:hypothetical protein
MLQSTPWLTKAGTNNHGHGVRKKLALLIVLALILVLPAPSNAYVSFTMGKVIVARHPKIYLLGNFLSNNALMENVDPANLEISANGTLVRNWSIAPLKKSAEPIAIMLGIDNGRHVPKTILDDFVWVVSQLANKKGKSDAVGITTLGGSEGFSANLYRDTNRIVTAVNAIKKSNEGPRLYDAMMDSLNHLANNDALLKYVVIASSGKDEGSKSTYDEVINLSRKSGIPITIIGLSEKDDFNRFGPLSKLAHLTGGEFTVVRDRSEMIQSYAAYVSTFLKQQLITINLEQNAATGPTKIEICYKSAVDGKLCKETITSPPYSGVDDLPSKELAGREPPKEAEVTPPVPAVEAGKKEAGTREEKKAEVNYAYYYLLAAMLIVVLAIAAKKIRSKFAARKIKEQFKSKPDISGRMSNNSLETIVDPGETISYLLEIPSENKEIKLFKDSLAIGSIEGNDIIIKDKFVSRKHAVLKFADNEWSVIDLNSTNGVFVNSGRVNKNQRLQHNDSIKIGNTVINFYLKNS